MELELLWLTLLIALGFGIVLIWACIDESKRKRERLAEWEARRSQQNAEWESQLQDYPWLRDVLRSSVMRERTIQFDLMIHRNQNGFVDIVSVVVDDQLVYRAVRSHPNEPVEHVNWKQEGF
jgi:hypothetical protein